MNHHAFNPEHLALTRRGFLCRCGMGMGALGLTSLLGSLDFAGVADGAESFTSPLAPKAPHFAPKAKRIIHIFANGGPSHVDTFDPKPSLAKYAGKALPMENLPTERKTGAAFPSPFKFKKYGQSGIEVSDLFPHVAESIDDIAVIRSMHADIPNHEPSLLLMNCGEARSIRPSMGSWVTYGLGSENQNLPGFISMCPGGYPIQESQNWQSGFLPGVYQGTYIDTKHTKIEQLIENIKNNYVSKPEQRAQLDLLQKLNHQHLARRKEDAQIEARIESFELAYRMQMDAADAFDTTREPEHIRKMYGEGTQARQLLIARRLIERGVRFVQVWHGSGQPWDNHDDIEVNHGNLARECDQAIGALLKDLKQRGMLKDTLVIWGGEFGRTPNAEGRDGRDHNTGAFTMWLAGGGVKSGHVHGASDLFGAFVQEGRVHVHDLHATILWLMGLDHQRLTFRYSGRDFRLTDVDGNVVREIFA
jgi:hypothetical protein